MSRTKSFGTPKRESHDASLYYSRNINNWLAPASAPQAISGPANDAVNEPASGAIADAPDGSRAWASQLYCASAEAMTTIPANSVGLAFTSPPYNVGKDYDDNMGLEEYLGLIRRVAREVYRVLIPGGRYVVNVANLGRKPYIPLHSFFYALHVEEHFLPMGEIIWQKARGASGSCAWGSWQSAKAPRLRDIHEYLLVFAKQAYSRPDRGASTIDGEAFMSATLSIWEIAPESAKRVGHPAPFPVELAARVIKLYSYADDVVLDPFMGSGTTCVAAKQLGRPYVGFDISPQYCDIAAKRLADTAAETQ